MNKMTMKRISFILMPWACACRVIALTLIKFICMLKKCLFIKNGWSHCTNVHYFTARQKFILNEEQQQHKFLNNHNNNNIHINNNNNNNNKEKLQRYIQQKQEEQEKQKIFSYKKIPKVKGLPIFGTIFDVWLSGSYPQLHNYIDRRHQQYGHIFSECLGGGSNQDAVFISSASLMRSVFLYEGQHPRHPLPEAWILYNKKHNCQRGLFFMEGKEWYHNRRILNRCLLNGNLNWINDHVKRCTETFVTELINIIEMNGNGAYEIDNIEQRLYRWSMDVIVSIIFGTTFSDNLTIRNALDDFSNTVHKIFESSSALMNFPAKLALALNLKIWCDFEENVTKVLRMGNDIIDMCMAMLDGDCAVDIDDDDDHFNGLYGKLKGADVPLNEIKRMFVDLAIAAGDTTAFSSAWALYLLSQNEDIQRKLQSESESQSEMDTNNNTNNNNAIIRGLIKETLRLYPAAPFIGRYLPNDITIDGYHFKKDTLMLLSLYTAGRDPKHFSEPLRVMPERWIRNPVTDQYHAVYQPHATLPFAIGNRSCIGRKVALSQMECLIAEVSKNFHIKCTNLTSIQPILRLVTVPDHPLNLLFTIRNHL